MTNDDLRLLSDTAYLLRVTYLCPEAARSIYALMRSARPEDWMHFVGPDGLALLADSDPRDAEIARLTAALAEQTAERVRFRKMVDADRYALAEALGLAEWHWPEPIAIARYLQKERHTLLLLAYYEKVELIRQLLAAAALRGETTEKGSE